MMLPLFDRANHDLTERLVTALLGGSWCHRERLAQALGVSVRQVRDAASQSRGAVISGQQGLKLTAHATEAEFAEAIAQMSSQVHQMTTRIAALRFVFESGRQMEKAS